MIFNAENFDIFRLGSVPVSYPPKNINTLALLVTPENIGALSLELEGELRYNVEAEPYFKTWVSRKSAEVEGGSVCLTVYEGDWLVILWNEIRIFRQEEFEKTFQVDHGPDAVNVASVAKHIGDPVIPRVGPNYDPAKFYKSAQDPKIYEKTDNGPMTAIATAVGELETDK